MQSNVLRYHRTLVVLGLVSSGVVAAACSSSGGNPTGPSTDTVPTVTVSATGFSPKEVAIPVGGRVRFVNSDTVNRQVNSNPFPTHDNCPAINEVDLMTPGQSKMTGVFSTQAACGFHEHLTEGDPEFRGLILIGNANPGDAGDDGY